MILLPWPLDPRARCTQTRVTCGSPSFERTTGYADALAAADDELDREAAAPDRARPRTLADHASGSSGARSSNSADRAVGASDPLPRTAEGQADHAWDSTAHRRGWRRRRRRRRRGGGGGGGGAG